MVAHMNREAYEPPGQPAGHLLEQEPERLWQKGATSGNSMRVNQVQLDCDGDAVLLLVEPAGPACHTGARSCFVAPPPPRASRLPRAGVAFPPARVAWEARTVSGARLALRWVGAGGPGSAAP